MGNNIMGVELNLDQEYIKGAVEDIVRAGIVKALGDPSQIVNAALKQTINKKVDRRTGEPADRGWDTVPYLNWLAEKVVEDTVRECIKEYIEENKDAFKAEILKQLSNPAFRKNTAVAFIDRISRCASNQYDMPIHVEFKPND